ncbi:unnamed protein product, partial [Closterium sp. Naga37s-1]
MEGKETQSPGSALRRSANHDDGIDPFDAILDADDGSDDASPSLTKSRPSNLFRPIQQLWRRPVVRFAVAQIFIVWAVAASVLYIQDVAMSHEGSLQHSDISGLGAGSGLGAAGQATLLEQLKKRFHERCPMRPPVCRPRIDLKAVAHSAKHYYAQDKPGDGETAGPGGSTGGSADGKNGTSGGGDGAGGAGDELPLVVFFAGIEGSDDASVWHGITHSRSPAPRLARSPAHPLTRSSTHPLAQIPRPNSPITRSLTLNVQFPACPCSPLRVLQWWHWSRCSTSPPPLTLFPIPPTSPTSPVLPCISLPARALPPAPSAVVAFEPLLHLTSEETQTHVHGVDARCPRLPYARPLRAYAKEMAVRLAETGNAAYLRARDSYPLGRVRTPLARPDLVHMLQLDGLLFNLKVVVISRGLPDAVRSAYRMGYHGGDLGLQVRIVEDEMVFLDTTMRMIPCSKYIVLDFDWVADSPEPGSILQAVPDDAVVDGALGHADRPPHEIPSPPSLAQLAALVPWATVAMRLPRCPSPFPPLLPPPSTRLSLTLIRLLADGGGGPCPPSLAQLAALVPWATVAMRLPRFPLPPLVSRFPPLGSGVQASGGRAAEQWLQQHSGDKSSSLPLWFLVVHPTCCVQWCQSLRISLLAVAFPPSAKGVQAAEQQQSSSRAAARQSVSVNASQLQSSAPLPSLPL